MSAEGSTAPLLAPAPPRSSEDGDEVFADALRMLEHAASFKPIDPEALERLKHPKAILQVSVPVRMDNGALSVFVAANVFVAAGALGDSVPEQLDPHGAEGSETEGSWHR